jgi:hypothetical protein
LHHGAAADTKSLKGIPAKVLVEELYEYRKTHRNAPMNDYLPSYVGDSPERAKFNNIVRTLHILMLEQGFYDETHAFCDADLADAQLFNISTNLQKDLRLRVIFLNLKKNGKLPEGVVRQDQYTFPKSRVQCTILGLGNLLTGTENITWN